MTQEPAKKRSILKRVLLAVLVILGVFLVVVAQATEKTCNNSKARLVSRELSTIRP